MQQVCVGAIKREACRCPVSSLRSFDLPHPFSLSLFLSTFLRGSNSINSISRCCHTFPSWCVRTRGDLFAVHIKPDMDTLCVEQTVLFEDIGSMYCHGLWCSLLLPLPRGMFVYGGSVGWLIMAAGVPYTPPFPSFCLPVHFIASPYFNSCLCFLYPLHHWKRASQLTPTETLLHSWPEWGTASSEVCSEQTLKGWRLCYTWDIRVLCSIEILTTPKLIKFAHQNELSRWKA